MRLVRIAALAICAMATLPAYGQIATLQDFRGIELALPDGARFSLTVDAGGHRFVLRLEENRDLLEALHPGQRRRIPEDDRFLAGDIDGVPGSWARINRIDGQISGGFFDGEELWLIDRVGRLSLPAHRRAPARGLLVYRYSDLRIDGLIDHGPIGGGAPEPGADFGEFSSHLREVAAMAGTAALALPVTIVSDTQFTNRHGNSAASVVAGRINFVDGIYSREVGTGIELLHHEILTDNDVLTSTSALDLLIGETDGNTLVQAGFVQFMRSGNGSDIPFAGVAHLFTGRDLDGNTVGIAYLGVLCDTRSGYGLDQDLANETTSALIFAHELGHNFGAGHDDDTESCPSGTVPGIMNSSINGSQEFSDCSLDAMAGELAGASCLIETEVLESVFANGFEP